jgi:hypothetical protein
MSKSKTKKKDEPPGMGQTLLCYIQIADKDQIKNGPVRENVWATIVGSGRVRLETLPSYSRDYAVGDIVGGRIDNGLYLSDVEERSGHSVLFLRLTAPSAVPLANAKIQEFVGIGCETAGGGGLFSVDIPSTKHQKPALQIAEQGKIEGLWHVSKGYWHPEDPTAVPQR